MELKIYLLRLVVLNEPRLVLRYVEKPWVEMPKASQCIVDVIGWNVAVDSVLAFDDCKCQGKKYNRLHIRYGRRYRLEEKQGARA